MKNSTNDKSEKNDKLWEDAEAELKIHARALGLAPGASEIFIKKSLNAAQKSLKNRKIILRADLTRTVSKELKKYNADLAYVFENYDKII